MSGVSDYRANANPAPGEQQSNKALLYKPLGATRVNVSNFVSTILLANPAIFRWILVRNFGPVSIWLTFNGPAVDGIGQEILPGGQFFVSPIPKISLQAIADGAANNNVQVTAI